MKITISLRLSFFIRTVYLQNFPIKRLCIGETVTEDEYIDLETAGCIFAAEHAAMNYLARAEQSRFLLTQKLIKKNHQKEYVDIALNYLISKKYLNDSLYAEAWLRNRHITKSEGRIKLESGLCAKGINRKIAKNALDNFFEITSEEELFEQALNKFRRLGKKDTKLQQALFRSGFSWKLIKGVFED